MDWIPFNRIDFKTNKIFNCCKIMKELKSMKLPFEIILLENSEEDVKFTVDVSSIEIKELKAYILKQDHFCEFQFYLVE
jgi:hypothetical protein